MYDIVLPSGLGRLTASGEGRGGLVGVVFMALTFTVISFACVAPSTAGSSPCRLRRRRPVIGSSSCWALAFSVTFALPFFVLALFPFLLKALPKSGSWLNTVKVVMGFLELAAAFKFLPRRRIELLLGKTEFLTYDLVLGVFIVFAWLAACICLAFTVAARSRRPRKSERTAADVQHRVPESRPLSVAGPVHDVQRRTTTAGRHGVRLGRRLPFAGGNRAGSRHQSSPCFRSAWPGAAISKTPLKQGEAKKKLVFLDFTATTCTNCKFNERNVFIKPEIKGSLGQYVLVHLYTDNVPPEYQSTMTGAENHELQTSEFKHYQLPLYAIVKPTDKGGYEVYGEYKEGKINNVAGFTQFLRDPLAGRAGHSRRGHGRMRRPSVLVSRERASEGSTQPSLASRANQNGQPFALTMSG